MRILSHFFILCLALSFGSAVAQPSRADRSGSETVWTIVPGDVQTRINILASDSLEGRRTGTAGADKAANYVASEFRRLTISPLDSEHTYFQNFDFSEHALDSNRHDRTVGRNVVGIIRGEDPTLRDEYVVVGAHYDHLGWGDRHFALDTVHAIHYGADDNASGVAGMLEIAENLAINRWNLRRSVILIAFSGEEEGLIGSTYFLEHPLVDRKKIVAMINMDMIGRMTDSTLILEGIGSSPTWKPLLSSIPLSKRFDLKLKQTGLGPSDHSKFYSDSIPVLFFFTGFHHDYHRATDTRDKINSVGESRIVQLANDIVIRLANEEDNPAYTRVVEDNAGKSTSFSVYVGGVPDYAYDGDGVKISEIRENSPAEKAGLKKDDVIVGFDGQKIKTIYDYTDALSKHKPDQVVEVTILRSNVRIAVPVTLGRRSEMH